MNNEKIKIAIKRYIISDDITVDDNDNIVAVPDNYKDKMGILKKIIVLRNLLI